MTKTAVLVWASTPDKIESKNKRIRLKLHNKPKVKIIGKDSL